MGYTYIHVYRELSSQDDSLWKEALQLEINHLVLVEFLEGQVVSRFESNILDLWLFVIMFCF